MDRALDEIVSERHRGGRRQRNGGGMGRGGDRRRVEYPRDGVRKSTREDHRSMDLEWVHDKFDDNSYQPVRGRGGRRQSPERTREWPSCKLRVDNLHYDLTVHELEDLFNRIGPVAKVDLQYDRSGRSEGVAFVTYEHPSDAKEAIREYDGANANHQPIRLTLCPASRPRRNPFDTVVSSRPLAERITVRSESPVRRSDVSKPPPDGVDRYVPGQGSRSPVPQRRRDGGGGRRDGRRPGARRERGERMGNGGGRDGPPLARDGRPRKTQEELDAEMDDYFGGNGSANVGAVNGNGEANGVAENNQAEDIEMAL